MTRSTRSISWIRAARKEFEDFPEKAQAICLAALTIAAEGGKADIAKPMKGLGAVFLRLRSEMWVVPSGWSMRFRLAVTCGWFMRSRRSPRRGIKTPQHEIDLIKDRLKRLKEMVR